MTRRSRGRAPLALEAALLALVLVAGLGLGRLTVAPWSWRVVPPVVLCVGVGYAVTATAARRAGRLLCAGAGIAAVVLVCSWVFEARTTAWGVPTPATARGFVDLFGRAGSVIVSKPTPLPATAGVVLCIAAGAGLAAVLARCLVVCRPDGTGTFGTGAASPSWVLALVPPSGLFCYASVLSSGSGRVWSALLFAGALLGLLVVADRAGARRRPAGSHRGAVAPAAAVVLAAMAVPLASSPALGSLRVHAFPFRTPHRYWPGPAAVAVPGLGTGTFGASSTLGPDFPPTPPAVPVEALALVDDLRAVITAQSHAVLFVAESPQPTYWQIASLTRFDGRSWTTDPVTASAARGGPAEGGPPVLPEPAPRAFLSTAVTMVGLRTSLLPAPPGTVSVVADATVTVRRGIGVVDRGESVPGLSYDVVSRAPQAVTPAAAGTVAAASLSPYLALPKVDPRVVALAHQIVRGAHGPLAKALALDGWFASGRYRYSLSPVAGGGDALTTFLLRSRTGFCQQFAGAYAVLARLDGLPTRLAVGFTSGERGPGGVYRVTGSDAHVWPEVYLGPAAGWVSFEPTPAAETGGSAVGVLTGAGAARSAQQGTLGEIRRAGTSARAQTGPSVTPRSRAGAAPAPRARHPAPAPDRVATLWLLGTALAVVATLGVLAVRQVARRLGGVFGELRHRSPRAAVLASWRRAARAAGGAGGRRAHETFAEYARRLPSPGRGDGTFAALTELAGRACYSDATPTAADVTTARRLRAEVCAGARRRGRRPDVVRTEPAARAPAP